jgi:[acyl-carrier-protein] S-malonyltransferase
LAPRPSPATVIAVVAGRAIDFAALEQRMADVRRGPRGRHLPPENAGPESTRMGRWLVQELVTEAVLEHEVVAAGLSGMSAQTLSALVERVTADVTVAATDVRAYYDRNLDLYARREVRLVRHAVVAERQAAEAIAGDGVADGEELEVRRGELAGDLEEALFRARPGDVVGPIRTEHGWHVARVGAITRPTITPFEDVRAAIGEELLAAARARAFGEWLETRRNALAVIEPAYAHPGDPVHGLPSHRH